MNNLGLKLDEAGEKNAYKKLEQLKGRLFGMKKVLIAFSGGVDSTFLSKVACDVLHGNVIAVTATSPTYSDSELEESKILSKEMGMTHIIIKSDELQIPDFSDNDPERCFYCKSELFGLLSELALSRQIDFVLDGSTTEDLSDYRPGRKAAEEQSIVSPLMDCGFRKDEIRFLSRKLGLKTWSKPSYACLASRFPYGTRITEESLIKIDSLEGFLKKRGFSQVRARYYGNLVRIELTEDEFAVLVDNDARKAIVEKAKELGFLYVTLDLQGYRTGSMNEVLSAKRQGRLALETGNWKLETGKKTS